MARTKRKRGFLETTVLPLVAGSALTLGGLAWLAADSGVELDLRGPVAVAAPPETAAEAITGAVAAESSPEPAATPAAAPPLVTVAAPDRNVTPEGVTSVPRHEGPYVRVKADPRPEEPKKVEGVETLYRRIVVLDAQSFRAVVDGKAVVVRIAGITTPDFAEVCTDSVGRQWKCGARARAELARLIGGRGVACTIPEGSPPEAPVAPCRVGTYDLGRWLVENGWADAEDPALERVEAEARRNGKGPP